MSLAACSAGATPNSEDAAHVTTHIYWGNNGIHKSDPLMATDHTIGVANLDGTKADQSLITDITFPSGVAARGDYVYWTDIEEGAIGRAKLDGTEVEKKFVTDGVRLPNGITVDDDYIYWSNNGTNSIGRVKIDGSDPDGFFIDGIQVPNGLAVDGEYLYWSNWVNQIGRVKLDGTDVDENFIADTGAQSEETLSPVPIGLAVDGEYIYWSNMQDHAIGRAVP